MASALLRTSTLRGSAFRRVISAAAAPSGEGGQTVRRTVPLRRLSHTGAPDDQTTKSLDEKISLFRRSIIELNNKVERRYLVYASLQKLVEERKLLNPFVQWSWQVGVVALVVLIERFTSSARTDN